MTRIVSAPPKVTQEQLGSIRDHRETVERREAAFKKAKGTLAAEEKVVIGLLRDKATVEEGPLKATLHSEMGSASGQWKWLFVALLERDYKGKVPAFLTRELADAAKDFDVKPTMTTRAQLAVTDRKDRLKAVEAKVAAMYPGKPGEPELIISGKDELEAATEVDPPDEMALARRHPRKKKEKK